MSDGFLFRLGWELAPWVVTMALVVAVFIGWQLLLLWWIVRGTPCPHTHRHNVTGIQYRCSRTRGHPDDCASAWTDAPDQPYHTRLVFGTRAGHRWFFVQTKPRNHTRP